MADGAAVGKWYSPIGRVKSKVGVSKGWAESCRELQWWPLKKRTATTCGLEEQAMLDIIKAQRK
jgi:hypothetical protein